MRTALSRLITQAAVADPRMRMLSGDHGYALFDEIRKTRPSQFINMGVAEQSMVGIAAGLCRTGLRPIVYGLAAFVPIRVLEQIKLDVCRSSLPVIFLGDGAGLVYSTLGASHQCAEDMASLRPLPGMCVYSPCDARELEVVFEAARKANGPSYIRLGKGDRPAVHRSALQSTEHVEIHTGPADGTTCLVATGSMVSVCQLIAQKLQIAAISIFQVKPLHESLVKDLSKYETVIVVEEHSRYGGLFSAVAELMADTNARPRIYSISLAERFSEKCGAYQYALSEHNLSDTQVLERIQALTGQSH